MVKKSNDDGNDARQSASARLSDTVRDSAQQIWLAGLGAFSKAQEEGGKVFEALVRDGVDLQRKTQSAAEGRLNEATSRMSSMASELSARAAGQFDKLEGLFEQRVERAMDRMGTPSADEFQRLVDRVDELQRTVDRLQAGSAPAKAPAGTPPRKRAPARKSAD